MKRKIPTKTMWGVLVATALGLAAAAALTIVTSGGAVPLAAAGGAAVAGKVTFAGAASSGTHAVTKNPEVCAAPAPAVEDVVKGAGNGLANVVVSIAAPAAPPLKTMAVTIDQKGCRYAPHVQAATVGSELTLKNSDAVLHNVHTYLDGKKSLFNIGMPTKGMSVKRPLKSAGMVSVACDAGHTWMSAYVAVFDHPYFAVSGADGSFRVEGVPAGSFDVTFWHEKLGTKTAKVTVPATGEVATSAAF